jgi:hypothetical protein
MYWRHVSRKIGAGKNFAQARGKNQRDTCTDLVSTKLAPQCAPNMYTTKRTRDLLQQTHRHPFGQFGPNQSLHVFPAFRKRGRLQLSQCGQNRETPQAWRKEILYENESKGCEVVCQCVFNFRNQCGDLIVQPARSVLPRRRDFDTGTYGKLLANCISRCPERSVCNNLCCVWSFVQIFAPPPEKTSQEGHVLE